MALGALTVRLYVRGSRSLKEKRQVVRSVLARVRGDFNVSAAEVEAHDDVKLAVLGFAAVAAEPAAVTGVLNQIAEVLRRHPVAEYLGGDLSVGREVV